METASVREASARVIAALRAAGRSRTTIKRHEAEFNAFARFLEARGRTLPTEVDCLDFIAERSGCRLAGLREPTSSRRAQLARRPLVLLMECLDGGMPRVGQATTPPVDRCPARFRAARDEYLAACRRRGNAEASVVTKQRAADAVPGLPGGGRPGNPRAGAGPGLGRVLGPAPAPGLRPEDDRLAAFVRWPTSCATCTRPGRSGKTWPGGSRRSAIPGAARRHRYPWTAAEVRLVLDQIDRQSAIGKRDYAMVVADRQARL